MGEGRTTQMRALVGIHMAALSSPVGQSGLNFRKAPKFTLSSKYQDSSPPNFPRAWCSACMLNHFIRVWLCNSTECSLSSSSVHWILQARILEWAAMPFSRGSSWPRDWTQPLMSPALAGGFFTTSATWEAQGLVQTEAETPSGRNRPEEAPFPGWLRLLGHGPPLRSDPTQKAQGGSCGRPDSRGAQLLGSRVGSAARDESLRAWLLFWAPPRTRRLLFFPSLSGCQETSALGTEYLFFFIAQGRNYLTLSILPAPPSQFLEISHRRRGPRASSVSALLRIHPREGPGRGGRTLWNFPSESPGYLFWIKVPKKYVILSPKFY